MTRYMEEIGSYLEKDTTPPILLYQLQIDGALTQSNR